MKARPILIATWGKPASWVMAKYSVRGSGPGIAAFSSTEALARAIDAQWTIILGLDTLFMEAASGKPSSYEEVVSRSKAYLERFKCGLEASIEALPGVINAERSKVRVTGNPQDFYMLAFLALVKRILSDRAVLPPVVALDITHGINFMPNLAMTASLNAAAYLSLARALRGQNAAWLEVYNSDPIIPSPGDPCGRGTDPCKPRGECEPTGLTIHRVIKQRAGVPEIISAVDKLTWSLAESGRRILRQRVGDEQLIKKVGSINSGARDTLRDAFLLVKAFRLGLAPEIIHMTRRLPGLREGTASTIEEALELWAEGIRVREDNGWTVVERRLYIDYGFELLVHALALAEALAPLEELGPTMRAAMMLRDAYGRIGARITQRITQTVQEREIDKIKRAFKKKGCYGRTLLRDLLDVPETRTDNPQGLEGCQKFARDLVAHGGWHSDVVVLTRCEGEFGDVLIELREGDPVCRENSGTTNNIWGVIEKKY